VSEYHKAIEQSTITNEQFLNLKEALHDGLLSFCTAAGIAALYSLMEEDVVNIVGAKGKHIPDRQAYRHGTEATNVTVAGTTTPILRPRIRTLGGQEVIIESYELARNSDLLCQVALNRMLHGLSSRNYNYACENLGSKGSSKSTVSRRFIKATEAEFKKLLSRKIPEIVVLFIDGVVFAEHNVIVAMGLDADGRKHVLGFKIGASENARVCQDLLVELCERGLHAEGGLLAVIDGSKALKKALKAVFGENLLIQRCQVHKKRNIKDYLPETTWQWTKQQLNRAYAREDFTQALRDLKSLATKLETNHPDAAASLREGLEETLTVLHLNVSDVLRRSLATTNLIESALYIVRDRTGNVKNWKNGKMVQRWVAAGLLEAETRFRRIKGYRDMVLLKNEIKRILLKQGDENMDYRAISSKTA
jgi:putative transposase